MTWPIFKSCAILEKFDRASVVIILEKFDHVPVVGILEKLDLVSIMIILETFLLWVYCKYFEEICIYYEYFEEICYNGTALYKKDLCCPS